MDMEWQPIATAPKRQDLPGANIALDGKPEIIAGWAESAKISFARWIPERDPETGTWSQDGRGYWSWDGRAFYMTPTHWMPLPEPPHA
jgi:hypothetical protein